MMDLQQQLYFYTLLGSSFWHAFVECIPIPADETVFNYTRKVHNGNPPPQTRRLMTKIYVFRGNKNTHAPSFLHRNSKTERKQYLMPADLNTHRNQLTEILCCGIMGVCFTERIIHRKFSAIAVYYSSGSG
jgi:hypothetical protein